MRSIKTAIAFGILLAFFVITSCSKSTTGFHLVSPANRSQNVPTNQVFTCTAVNNAVTYSFTFNDQTDPNGSFSSPTLVTNTYTPTQLVSGHTYTWEAFVSTTTGGGSQLTETWSFSVQ